VVDFELDEGIGDVTSLVMLIPEYSSSQKAALFTHVVYSCSAFTMGSPAAGVVDAMVDDCLAGSRGPSDGVGMRPREQG
jgi:hypothetical protein